MGWARTTRVFDTLARLCRTAAARAGLAHFFFTAELPLPDDTTGPVAAHTTVAANKQAARKVKFLKIFFNGFIQNGTFQRGDWAPIAVNYDRIFSLC